MFCSTRHAIALPRFQYSEQLLLNKAMTVEECDARKAKYLFISLATKNSTTLRTQAAKVIATLLLHQKVRSYYSIHETHLLTLLIFLVD